MRHAGLFLLIGLLSFVGVAPGEPGKESSSVKIPDLTPEQVNDPKAAALAADAIEKTFAGQRQPEAIRMLVAILRKGGDIGGQDGWFGPAATRLTWPRLLEQQGLDPKTEAIPRDKFHGPEALFKRLDRDGDGRITPGDLDWSEKNPWVQQAGLVTRFFRRINTRGDGRVTREDLDAFFQKAGKGKDHVTVEDLREALLAGGGYLPGDAPTRAILVNSLRRGELGALDEGPALDQPAPDFALKTPDGERTYQLSKLIGKKPVVLVFGNFTCSPFRAFYPEVDALYQRYKDDAVFLMVYVREAHPTDGWKMEVNARAGVTFAQPTTYGERVKVCDQFCSKLKPTMPVVVDDITDVAGNGYSGLPARLYVIDTQGKVAYKGGRGPFGFRPGEMEQALVLTLLERK
jgi:thiol-disulfide isomerase/thioredoxin